LTEKQKKRLVIRWFWMSIMLFLINVVILPFIEKMPITTEKVLMGIPISILGGLALAYFLKLYENRF
tara:strand:+ start:73086 stop:73286 length:201 start_codon:yes stop_codon:yes gene_type:complete